MKTSDAKKRRKSRIQAGMIFLAALMALFAQLYFKKQPQTYPQRILDKATAYYNEGKLNMALDLIETDPEQLLPLKDGCELVISVFAQSNKLDLLGDVSKKCIEAEKAVGIAHEGYAKSLASMGKELEAIMALEKEAKKYQHPRIYGAIANLYMLRKDYEGVGSNILLTIEHSDTWTPWANMVLKTRPLKDDKTFIKKFLKVIAQKPKPQGKIKSELEQLAKRLDSSIEKERLQ